MDAWRILGLDGPTDDLKVIKSAYAKKLRITRPDDDPEGFMALRDALEAAKYEAQFHSSEPLDAALSPHSETANDGEIEDLGFTPLAEDKLIPKTHRPANEAETPQADAAEVTPNPSERTLVEQVMDDVIALLADPFGRAELARWQALFEDPRLDGIDEAIDFEDYFRCYLLDQFGYFDGDTDKSNQNRKRPLLTTRVGTYIFTKMGWRETDGRPLYMQDQIEWLRRDLDVINRDRPKARIQQQIRQIEETTETASDGLSGWMIGGILFGLYTLGKAITNHFSNGAF